MNTPPKLKSNSHVRIVSTARKIGRDHVDEALSLLDSWGFRGSLGNNLLNQNHQFSGTIEERVADLQQALDDSDIDMIWCARGGYGTVSLIDHLDFGRFMEKPKWIVGYSDITGLLCHVHNLGVSCLHGPMPINFNEKAEQDTSDFTNLLNWLQGEDLSYGLPNHDLNRKGDCNGEVVGGNLSLIYSTLGTVSSPSTLNNILFLEDLDEYLYHIDRMMLNLKRNGLLSGLAGLIVGGLTDMNDNDIPFGKNAEEIIFDYTKDFDYPVYFGFPAGHCSPNQPVPFGTPTKIENSVISFTHL
jgi:muramoyltetrapeptide carboxypeptidase